MLLKGPCPCRRVCLERKEEEGSVLSREAAATAEWYVHCNIFMIYLVYHDLRSQPYDNPHRSVPCGTSRRHSAMLLRLWQQLLVHRSFHVS